MRDKKPKRKDFCWNFKMGENSLLGNVKVLDNVGITTVHTDIGT